MLGQRRRRELRGGCRLRAAGSSGARPGAGRRHWEGGRVLPGPGRTRRGAGGRCPPGAAARANFAPRLGRAPRGPAGCTAASALTWPSRERPAAPGGARAGRPPLVACPPAAAAAAAATAANMAGAVLGSGEGRTGGRGSRAGSGLGPGARGRGLAAWRAGGAAAGPGAAERHGCTGAFVIPRSAPRAGGGVRPAAPAAPRPRAARAGRGGVGAGERAAAAAAAAAGPGPLCSLPPPPAPAARGSAILASGARRHGGRHGRRCRCRPGPRPQRAAATAAPGPARPPGVAAGDFRGSFFHQEAFDKMEGELWVSG